MQFKLQSRLWHLFALTAIIAALCAVPPLGLVSAAVLLVSLMAYALTYGFLWLCRAIFVLLETCVQEAAQVLLRRRR